MSACGFFFQFIKTNVSVLTLFHKSFTFSLTHSKALIILTWSFNLAPLTSLNQVMIRLLGAGAALPRPVLSCCLHFFPTKTLDVSS